MALHIRPLTSEEQQLLMQLCQSRTAAAPYIDRLVCILRYVAFSPDAPFSQTSWCATTFVLPSWNNLA